MQIELSTPISNDFDRLLQILNQFLRRLVSLKREEEHQLTIPSALTNNPFLATAIGLLVKQKQKDGYLIKVSPASSLLSVLYLDPNNNFSKDWPIIKQRVTELFPSRPDLQNLLFYLTGELLDNIRDHSRSPLGAFSLSTVNDEFYLTVADTGISIPNAFKQAGLTANERETLKQAINGTSTKISDQRGTGLPSIKKLMLNVCCGEMTIISANSYLKADSKKEDCRLNNLFWQGTIVFLKGFMPQKTFNLYDYLY